MAVRAVCSLCRGNEPRAGCPRCEERQPSLFSLPPPEIPDDAETVTVEELAESARVARRLHDERLARLGTLARPIRIGLVGCAKLKRDRALPARELYRSPLFAASLAHAERTCDECFVVSAAHGLLALDDIVQPYDRCLRELRKTEREAWGSRLVGAVSARFGPLPLHLVLLAGLEYARPIQAAARGRGWELEAPLAKQTIGQRLAWLKSQVPPPRRSRKRGAA